MLYKILNLKEEVGVALKGTVRKHITRLSQLELAKTINYALASIGYCSITQNTCSYTSLNYK